MKTVLSRKPRSSDRASEGGFLHVAQLGAGHWGVNLIRNLSELPEVGRFTVCDGDPTRLDFVRERYPTVEVNKDAESVLNDPSVDGVIVALPASLHYTFAKKALLNGKHVLVEKPLALRLDEARELDELARKRQKVLLVGHTFLYNDAVRKVRDYIESGELGEIYYITAQRLNLGRVRQDVNALWNLAPHDVSIILYWLNELPSDISASGLTFLQEGIEDVVFVNLRFPSKKAAHIHVSWLDPRKTRKIVIVGSKKMLIYDDVSVEAKIVIYDKGVDRHDIGQRLADVDNFAQFQLRQRSGDILIPKLDLREPLRRECEHFVHCVAHGATPLTDGAHGCQVVDILAKAQEHLEASRARLL